MVEWKKIQIGQFLKEREGWYDPADFAVQGLKRLNKIDFSGEIHLIVSFFSKIENEMDELSDEIIIMSEVC